MALKKKSIKINAYAKLNLYLKITGLLKNGFHSLKTLFVAVDLYDTVTINFIPSSELEINVRMTDFPNLPEEKNTAYKAALLFAQKTKIKGKINITVKKRIPEGAGLGGSSADAAGVLRGLKKMFNKLDEKKLLALAARVGSDAPFLIKGGFAYATGKGEKLKFIKETPEVFFVIVYPQFKIESKQAYEAFDKLKNKKNLTLNIPFNRIITNVRRENWEPLCRNDFYHAVLKLKKANPYGKIHKLLLENGAKAAFLTGSGSAYVGIFKKKNTALKTARGLKKVFPDFFVRAAARKLSY